jgi:hypothetical protein
LTIRNTSSPKRPAMKDDEDVRALSMALRYLACDGGVG